MFSIAASNYQQTKRVFLSSNQKLIKKKKKKLGQLQEEQSVVVDSLVHTSQGSSIHLFTLKSPFKSLEVDNDGKTNGYMTK